jgi:hypothetical protein
MILCHIKVIANRRCCIFTMGTVHAPRFHEQSFPQMLGLSLSLSQQPNSLPTTLLAEPPEILPSNSHAWNRIGGR